MQVLLDHLTREQADTFGLVLLSSGIQHDVRRGRKGWALWVAQDASEEAERLLKTYLDENKGFKPSKETPMTPYRKTWSGVGGVLVLLAFHVAITLGHDAGILPRLYGSSARHVVSGEWYRCTTALLLHADSMHLAGNLVGLAIFATAVCSISGWGVGWLLILVSGISGNLINAYVYGYGHNSIGASTAVFGALGLLSSYQFLKKIQASGTRFQILLPLGAGLALLAFTGSSSHTDIMAHLFGFLSGVFIGLVYYGLARVPSGWRYQAGALVAVVVVLVISWVGPTHG
ncbi:MAG: rhomboid family intramembrane serine protease [Desulfobacterales bacterium]|nr:rhomboid family intramembrane serine protease [Desulfobacterales bacterium]MDX2510912.1 rhomboid family intramembrane serine protease [Desulfobacterales bacterium]